MTPEAQRIAIAEACGWQQRTTLGPFHGRVYKWIQTVGDHKLEHYYCPDYLSDLNAMHEAEKKMQITDWEIYYDNLVIAQQGEFKEHEWPLVDAQIVHATAAQRAQAFLRTLNLWDDSKKS